MLSGIPKYSARIDIIPSSVPPHDHGRAGAGHGPAEVGAHLATLHLAAAAFPIVVAVAALAIRSQGTGVVDVVAQLAHVLDHHVHAVRVALTQMPAAGVVRATTAEADAAVAHVLTAFALFAEAVVFELQQGGEGEGVVGAGDIDILGAHPGVGPQDLARVFAGNRRDRPVLVVHVGAGFAHAPGDAADQHAGMATVAGALGAGDDDGGGIVGLHAAIEQMQRLADDAARQHVLYRNPLLVIGLGIVGGMRTVRGAHRGHLRRRRAKVVHVPHEGKAEELAGALPAVGPAVQHVAGDRHRRAGTGAADAHLRIAVHCPEDHHRFAHAGLDHAHRHADQRFARGAPAQHIPVELEAEAEVP